MRLSRRPIRFLSNLIDRPAVILLYHRVTKLEFDPQLLAVSPENFDDQVGLLKKKYHLISVDEFTHLILAGKKLPKKSVVISFDDGYADNLYEALPILESHNAQSIFYISTAKIDTLRELWWDDLERIFFSTHTLPENLSFSLGEGEYCFDTSTRKHREKTYYDLHPLVKNCPTLRRDALLDRIVEWSGVSPNGRATHRMLSSREVELLGNSNSAVIGAHTHNHPKLSVCSPGEQRGEILRSKNVLESILSRKIVHFSYPFGTRADYSMETVRICKELGFILACANTYNQVHRWQSPFELPRILVRNWSVDEFETKMKRFFAY